MSLTTQSVTRAAPAFRHVLVVGGTGMLRQASVELMKRSQMVTSVARTCRSLWALDALCPPGGARHRLVIADWSHPEMYVATVRRHVLKYGYPDLVIAWVHEPRLAAELMPAVSGGSDPCLFLHLIGSRDGSPLAEAYEWQACYPELPRLRRRQVVLGYQRGNAGRRWLSHEVICEGVLEAIETEVPIFVIGLVAPEVSSPRPNG